MTPAQEAKLDYVEAQCKDIAGRVNGVSAALKALATGLGPVVQKAVEDALAASYDATVTITPKP